MKTYRNIYSHIWAYENLYEAWRKAARGKRSSAEVAGFEFNLIDNLNFMSFRPAKRGEMTYY